MAAVAVGFELRPTTVAIFGDPRVGTRLMQDVQAAGFELPLRALVWTDGNGETWLGYTDMCALAERHGASLGAVVDSVVKALAALAAEVTQHL